MTNTLAHVNNLVGFVSTAKGMELTSDTLVIVNKTQGSILKLINFNLAESMNRQSL